MPDPDEPRVLFQDGLIIHHQFVPLFARHGLTPCGRNLIQLPSIPFLRFSLLFKVWPEKAGTANPTGGAGLPVTIAILVFSLCPERFAASAEFEFHEALLKIV